MVEHFYDRPLLARIPYTNDFFLAEYTQEKQNITTKITPPKLYFPNENLLHTAIVVYIYQWNISAVVCFAT